MSIVVDRNMAACFRDVDFITAARTVTGVPEKDSKDMHCYATALDLPVEPDSLRGAKQWQLFGAAVKHLNDF